MKPGVYAKSTPEVWAAVMDWDRRRKEIPKAKQLAHQLGISLSNISYILMRRGRLKHRRQA